MSYLLALWKMMLVLPQVDGSCGHTKVECYLFKRHVGMEIFADQCLQPAEKRLEREIAHTARIVADKHLYPAQL